MAVTFLVTGASGLIGFKILLVALAGGHNVRYTVRSEEKARIVSSNPAVEKLAPGDRLTPFIIPDLTAEGAFDEVLGGVTHVIHAGGPVPMPTLDPTTQVFEPTVKITSALLSSALKSPTVQRVVVTSSVVANIGLNPPKTAAKPTTRLPLPNPLPSTFDHVFAAYVTAKILETHRSDDFVRENNPHFSLAHVHPGYVLGRNELILDASAMQIANSSNNFIVTGMVGDELPFPIHGGFAHIDDVADLHMKVALSPPPPLLSSGISMTKFGISKKINYDDIFDIVQRAFPKAVAEGIFKRGKITTWAMEYDDSETREFMGREFRSFESAVEEVAGQ